MLLLLLLLLGHGHVVDGFVSSVSVDRVYTCVKRKGEIALCSVVLLCKFDSMQYYDCAIYGCLIPPHSENFQEVNSPSIREKLLYASWSSNGGLTACNIMCYLWTFNSPLFPHRREQPLYKDDITHC